MHRIVGYYHPTSRKLAAIDPSKLDQKTRFQQNATIAILKSFLGSIAIPMKRDMLEILPMLNKGYFENPEAKRQREMIVGLLPKAQNAIKKSTEGELKKRIGETSPVETTTQVTQAKTSSIITADRSHQDRHESIAKELGITLRSLDINVSESYDHRARSPKSDR